MIIGIRHLPTPLNKEHILQGSIDTQEIILSADDDARIQNNLEKIQSLELDELQVFCSELKRTQLTAESYGITNFEISPLLNELSFGEFEGKPKADFLKVAGNSWYENVYESPLEAEVKKLESNIEAFLEINQNKNCLLFAHGAFLRALLSKIEYGDIARMNQKEVKNNELIFAKLEV